MQTNNRKNQRKGVGRRPKSDPAIHRRGPIDIGRERAFRHSIPKIGVQGEVEISKSSDL